VRTIGIVGDSESGKTLLCEELISRLSRKGYRVGYLKFSKLPRFDVEGKDTYRATGAGAEFAAGVALEEVAIFHRRGRWEQVLQLLPQVDFLIVEGGRGLPIPKILVGGGDEQGVLMRWQKGDPVDPILEKIEQLPPVPVALYVDGRTVNVNKFVGRLLYNIVKGFLLTLKGVGKMKDTIDVKINVREVEQESRRTA